MSDKGIYVALMTKLITKNLVLMTLADIRQKIILGNNIEKSFIENVVKKDIAKAFARVKLNEFETLFKSFASHVHAKALLKDGEFKDLHDFFYFLFDDPDFLINVLQQFNNRKNVLTIINETHSNEIIKALDEYYFPVVYLCNRYPIGIKQLARMLLFTGGFVAVAGLVISLLGERFFFHVLRGNNQLFAKIMNYLLDNRYDFYLNMYCDDPATQMQKIEEIVNKIHLNQAIKIKCSFYMHYFSTLDDRHLNYNKKLVDEALLKLFALNDLEVLALFSLHKAHPVNLIKSNNLIDLGCDLYLMLQAFNSLLRDPSNLGFREKIEHYLSLILKSSSFVATATLFGSLRLLFSGLSLTCSSISGGFILAIFMFANLINLPLYAFDLAKHGTINVENRFFKNQNPLDISVLCKEEVDAEMKSFKA